METLHQQLTAADRAMFRKIGVGERLLTEAQIVRVDDRQGREFLGMNGKHGRFEGILFPNVNPLTGNKRGYVIRLDHPELETGEKPLGKYMHAYGDRPHLYFAPGAKALIEDPTVPAIVVEAQKSVLAVTEWSLRTGKKILVVGSKWMLWMARPDREDGDSGRHQRGREGDTAGTRFLKEPDRVYRLRQGCCREASGPQRPPRTGRRPPNEEESYRPHC